jgi:type I restriction enzyme M protein
VYDIITPMFDPKNPQNTEKINYLIQQNFKEDQAPQPPEGELKSDSKVPPLGAEGAISYANLTDLLDFSRKDFNKAFSLTPKKNNVIESKWELVKLENIMQITRGASPRPIDRYITTNENGINWIKIGDVAEGTKYVTKTVEKITLEGAEKSRMVNEGDFIQTP